MVSATYKWQKDEEISVFEIKWIDKQGLKQDEDNYRKNKLPVKTKKFYFLQAI